MDRFRRLIILLLFLLFIRALFFVKLQNSSEKYLQSRYITFDHFPTSYARALRTSTEHGDPLEYDYSSFAEHNKNNTIPQTIHFIWFKDLYKLRPGATQIPSIGSDAPGLCRNFNPDFTINLWNASSARELLEEHYAWFLPTYDSYKHPIQRVDAFKYFLLWHYGGVYMDLDIACRRSLIPLLQFPAWFPKAMPLGVNNDLMAAKPHHPLILKMIDNLSAHNVNLLVSWLTVFYSTGPQFTSDILKQWYTELPRAEKERQAGPDGVFVLPQEFYSEEYTFFGHSPGGTWYEDDVLTIMWLLKRSMILFLFLAIISIGVLGIVLSRRRQLKMTASILAR